MRSAVALAICLTAASCSSLSSLNPFGGSKVQPGQPGYVQGFLGGVVADEPRAALAGREVLSAGGNAADAAVATAFTLAVTLPSRAGLGGGGGCIAYSPDKKSVNAGVPDAIMFTPIAPASLGARADRPAAVPMMARGIYLLHARYGRRPFESLVVPAERFARLGVPASRALTDDLNVVAGPLFADPAARAIYARDGMPLKDGDLLVQPDLGATLSQIRVAGVGDFYQGALARRIEQETPLVGGPITVADLRAARPRLLPVLRVPEGSDQVAFLPPPADGGLAAAVAFKSLQVNPQDYATAAARGLGAAAMWRQGGVTDEQVLDATILPSAGTPALPASTTFATLDHDGNAVVCALSVGNLFGTGRIVPGLGFLLAASPASAPPPLYAAALAWNDHIKEFRAEVGGSGQAGAPLAVAAGMYNTLRSNRPMPVPVPDPGRANVIECNSYLPSDPNSCGMATDPRGAGLAAAGQ